MVSIAVMVVVCLSSHIYDCYGYRQHRRVLILDELTDVFCNDKEKENKPYYNEYLHSHFSYTGVSNPIKSKIPGSLEGQISAVTLDEQAVFRASHMQLHSVTAFDLEGHII